MIDVANLVSEPILSLLKWLSSPLTAVVTGFFAVQLSLKRFYTEKWWEKRSEAYSSIMESLHHIREHAEHEREAATRNTELPQDLEKRLSENVVRATANVRLRRDVGSFLISDDAVVTLNALLRDLKSALELGHEGRFLEHYEARIAAVDRALDQMRKKARDHLSIR